MAQRIKINSWGGSHVAVGPDFLVVGVCPAQSADDIADNVQKVIDCAAQLDYDQLPPLESQRFFRLFIEQLRMELDMSVTDAVKNRLEELFDDAVIVKGDEIFKRNVNLEFLSGKKGRRIEVYDHITERLLMMINGPWEEADEEAESENQQPEISDAKSHANLVRPSFNGLDGQNVGDLNSSGIGMPVPVASETPEPAPSKPEKKKPAAASPKKGRKIWRWVERIFFIVCIGLLALAYFGAVNDGDHKVGLSMSKLSVAESDLNEARSELNDVRDELKEKDQLIEKIGNKVPILIESLQVGVVDYDNNVLVSHGSTIYSSNTQYLSPRITGLGLESGSVTLYVRFFKNGVLDENSSGDNKSVYSKSIYITKGTTESYILGGWGGKDSGWWKSGNYRFEIWYGDMCLAAKNFYVY